MHAANDGPRERLAALGPEALGDSELVALLLRTGGNDADALETARELLVRHGGLSGLARASVRELRGPGVGPVKIASLRAALELGQRMATRRIAQGDAIGDPADVYHHFYPRLRHALCECFYILLLDGRHRLSREVLVSKGTLTASLVHPREVFRPALREAAASIVLVHNHPSGDPTPSAEDLAVTERLVRAGEILGVGVLDHVVVAEQGYRSLREIGAFPG